MMKLSIGLLAVMILVGACTATDQNLEQITKAAEVTSQANGMVAGNEGPAQAVEFTMAQVSEHKDADSCYTVVRGQVYDVTDFIDMHPGGSENILKLCGIDGTELFVNKHGGMEKQEMTLQDHYIGNLV